MRFAWMLGLLGACVPCLAAAAGFSFGPPERLTLERGIVGNVAIGDVDGDGREDLARTATVRFDYRLSVFLQQADGTLGPAIDMVLPTSAAAINPVAMADLDADGADEVLVGIADHKLLVVRLDAAGTLVHAAHPAGTGCTFIATGDIDGDGHVDVVCHDWKVTAAVLLGDGIGGFRSSTRMTTSAGGFVERDVKALRLRDVTGDGRPDLLAAAASVNAFYVYANDGQGGFTLGRTYMHPWSDHAVYPGAIEALDVDGDGALEVVTASPENQPDAGFRVYRRNASGFLEASWDVPGYDSATALHAADLDGDGTSELVAGHFDFNAVTVAALHRGPTVTRFDLPGFRGHGNGIALGDLNGDGCSDLAAHTMSGLLVLRGCRERRTSLPRHDFDGDGVSDVLWAAPENSWYLRWNWGNVAGYEQVRSIAPNTLQVRALGDFDGDGASDIFLRDAQTGENRIVRSGWYFAPVEALVAPAWDVVGSGDFDGDDRSDLLWRHAGSGANAIWLGGDGFNQMPIASVADVRWQVAGVGDFDDDGRSDILWRHAATGSNDVWPGGVRAGSRSLARMSNLDWEVAGIGDFDGDRRDDVAWRNAANGANTVWLGANAATQLDTRDLVGTDWVIAMVGDFEGDGEADFFWRNLATGDNVIWPSGDASRERSTDNMDILLRVVNP